MTSPQPFLTFPDDQDGWLALAGRTADRIERIRLIDAELKRDEGLSTFERLRLWNDAETLLLEVADGWLVSEAHPDPDVRAEAEKQVQAAEAFTAERLLDRELWAVFAEETEDELDPATARVLAFLRRDFRRGGIDLEDHAREQVRLLADRDTALSLAFSRNIREGRREIQVRPEGLDGMPQDFIDAHPAGEDGLVTLTTDYPDLMPVRDYATTRSTRHAIVGAYSDLAWPENDEILAELLAVRHERAQLLGFDDWAEYETETRMIGSGAAIPTFLQGLDDASAAAAAAEYDELLTRLQADEPDADAVSIADFWYLLGALKREKFDVDAQIVRSYFPFERVLEGVLQTTGRLLGLEYVPADVATWHDDVRSYDVIEDGAVIGRIHLDLHPRDGKYSHAACFPLVPGIVGRSLPEGVLLCNFSRGLLEHDQVLTFFHEFGHLVHYILSGRSEWARFSGIQTEWDFVEAPSQLLEEWAWDADVLASFSSGPDGAPIPADLVERMRAADAFGRALEVRRQLGHANVSYHLHVDRPEDLQAATEHWYALSSPVRPLAGRHTYAGFGHLTGYGACYYTYQWSLVIARDLLTRFGDDLMNERTAQIYRTEILEAGATRDAADMVESFLGRPYSFDAYRAWLAGQ